MKVPFYLLPFIPSVVDTPPPRLVLSFMAALVAVALPPGPAAPPTLTDVVLPMVALVEAAVALVEAIVAVLVLLGTMVLARPVVSLMAAKRLPKPSFGSDIIEVENSEKKTNVQFVNFEQYVEQGLVLVIQTHY